MLILEDLFLENFKIYVYFETGPFCQRSCKRFDV